ncbi:penicillin acylase family protein [Halosegnis marinus]|uniref:Penicillin acylase family protein n=1 Tax=Halosegnis marinus TaxID=3034023 RepID=A0ABD5ZJR4_9EURY|nr:penicillin acylase family protein [Halosegnis sp. DT85]
MDSLRGAAVSVVALAILVSAAVGGGGYLSLAAPASGDAWAPAYGANDGSVGEQATRAVAGARTVESPYGPATVRIDDDGVPHIEAESEGALYYAVGYVQARDRLFQMDIQRRLMRGQTAEIAGEAAVESDRFYRQMGFADAAEASWDEVEGTAAGDAVEAYTAGVNTYIDTGELPTEFRLNDYEPDEWTPTDSLLVGKLIAWQLTGDFRDAETATIRDTFGNASDLYPERLDHDATIMDRSQGGEVTPDGARAAVSGRAGDFSELYESLSGFERDLGIGSNSWVVSGEHTADGAPIVANDPHLSLQAPPVWYEMHLETGDMNTRGVAFPGLPFTVIGRTENVSWGFTNVGADQTDLYTFARPSEDTYVYGNETREIQREVETIEVAGAEDVEVTIERTVKGPLLEREGQEVAVSWLGLTGTREAMAVYDLNRAEDLDDVREALRRFDTPTQNIVAADRNGGTLFRITGKYPYRYTDGERVAGNLPFNATEGEGEWRGWVPYGETDWNATGAFVPYNEVPHVDDPDVLATANQRTTDAPGFYLAYSERYADPYRGERIYQRLEARVDSGEPVTAAFMQELQRDTRSLAADGYVPEILDARSEMSAEVRAEADTLEGWDSRLSRDSRAALLYALFREEVRNATLYDEFHLEGLDSGYYPHHYALQQLPDDSRWFDDTRTPETETRADVYAEAFARAVERAEREGWETYGDYNVVALDHPFPVGFLDYPELATDGGPFTVSNFRVTSDAGSSWRMVVAGDESYGVIPGGQSGNPYSPHYDDQLDDWANGRYHAIPTEASGPVVIRFVGGEDE